MRRADNGHQGAPGGLRLKFEPPRAARFWTQKFDCTVSHYFTVQYGGERADRVRHQVFCGRKPRQENLNSQSRNPDGRSFFYSLTNCQQLRQDPRWAQDARNNGWLQRWRNITQSTRVMDLSDGSPWSRDNFLFPPPLQIREGLTIPTSQ